MCATIQTDDHTYAVVMLGVVVRVLNKNYFLAVAFSAYFFFNYFHAHTNIPEGFEEV